MHFWCSVVKKKCSWHDGDPCEQVIYSCSFRCSLCILESQCKALVTVFWSASCVFSHPCTFFLVHCINVHGSDNTLKVEMSAFGEIDCAVNFCCECFTWVSDVFCVHMVCVCVLCCSCIELFVSSWSEVLIRISKTRTKRFVEDVHVKWCKNTAWIVKNYGRRHQFGFSIMFTYLSWWWACAAVV